MIEQSNENFSVKPVVLGLTDETDYEVIAGLTPKDTVVVDSTATKPSVSSTNGNGPGGGNNGG